MAKRNYPNNYYAWYNDDNRVAILERVTSTDNTETHRQDWDTFQSSGDLSGTISDLDGSGSTATATTSAAHNLENNDRITISGTTTYAGKYTVTVSNTTQFTFTHTGSTSNETGSFVSLFVDDGLRLTYHSKYEPVSAITADLKTSIGLDSGMHHAIVCYVKYRLYEDMGDLQSASYFKKMFDIAVKQYPSRKSGVRALAVPRI